MMDEIRCLLEEMADAGIRLWVEDGKLKFRAPSGAMTAERANLIKKNRDAVIAALNEPRPIKREPEKRSILILLQTYSKLISLARAKLIPTAEWDAKGTWRLAWEALNSSD